MGQDEQGGGSARRAGVLGVWRFRVAAIAVCSGLLSGSLASGAEPLGANPTGRDAAVRSIPLDQMTSAARQKVWSVVSEPTLHRRMPVQSIHCEPDLYLFLVRHPEVVVNMWQLMGVTKVELDRTGPYSLAASDGAGTHSTVELLFGTRDIHVLYAEGYYDGPLFRRRVQGRCVMVLASGYGRDAQERDVVTSRLDVFIQIDHLGAELLARTVHPLMGKTADSNFAESIGFLEQVSDVARRNGPGMQQLAERLNDVDPTVRQRFSQLVAHVGERSRVQAITSREPGEPQMPPLEPAERTSSAPDRDLRTLVPGYRARDLQLRRERP